MKMIKIRDGLAGPVQAITKVGNMVLMLGFMMAIFTFGPTPIGITALIILAATAMFGASAVFQLVTLPIEYDASAKAKKELKELGYLKTEKEIEGVKKTLNAAALTYLVAFLTSLIMLLWMILRIVRMSRR